MNVLNILTGFYAKLHNYPGVPFQLLTPFRKLVRGTSNVILPRYLSKIHKKRQITRSEIIVSFTSFPARINNVWQVVSCMLHQTLQPKQIILWLSKEQFQTIDDIPESLKELEGDIFKIRMVEGDIRSHKKYYYAAKEFPDDWIFLIDDDLYYPTTILARTWETHIIHPERIICNYGYRIAYREDGTIDNYKKWKECLEESDDDTLFFGSGGGTLINPSRMNNELTNINLAQKLTPIADDIWLNAIARLSGIKLHMISHGLLLPVAQKDNVRLAALNRREDKNDLQLSAIQNHFGPIFSTNS